jgi:serine/threonine-protein kinase HipA
MEKKYCLCCGKEINEGLWHKSCIKRFFGTSSLPIIEVNDEDLKTLAIAQLQNKTTVQGVQEKLSLHLDLDSKRRPRLTIVGFPTGYILKPQASSHKQLPEFEHTAMLLAELCGISVVPHALIEINDKKELAYITKRVDRNGGEKIHMEDFAQASGTLTDNKYRSSYEECMELIDKYSDNPYLDKINLFRCLYFCYVIGNSDVHLKNFSFIMNDEGKLSLCNFYDLLPTKVILPSDQDDLGMRFNGKKNNLKRRDFDEFAKRVGIDEKAKENVINLIDGKVKEMDEVISNSSLNQNAKSQWIKLISRNLKRFNLNS